MDYREIIRSAFGTEEKEPDAPLFGDDSGPAPVGGIRQNRSGDDTAPIKGPYGGSRPKKEKRGWFFRSREQTPYMANGKARPAPVPGQQISGVGNPFGQDRSQAPVRSAGQVPRQNPGQAQRQNVGQAQRQNAGQVPGQNPGQNSGQGAQNQNRRAPVQPDPGKTQNQSVWRDKPKQKEGADVFAGFGKRRSRFSDPLKTFDVPEQQPGTNGRIMNMNGDSVGSSTPIRIYTPKKVEDRAAGKKMHYGEYKRIIDDFVQGYIVMLNLKNLDTGADDEKNKVLCLVFGAVAAVDGYIYMVADNMYLIARNSADVAGAIKEGRAGAYIPGL